MENRQALLNFIGIAKRAGKIVTGQDLLLAGIRKSEVKFLFMACDTGKSTKKKFTDKTTFYQVPLDTQFTKTELSDSIGMNRTLIGITDIKMAKRMVTLSKLNTGE